MNMRRTIAAALAASALLLSGCGGTDSSSDGSGADAQEIPSLKQIYAANTLEQYLSDGIQPSVTTCLREDNAEVYTEDNILMTAYQDDTYGTVVRYRKNSNPFRYFFQKDGTEYTACMDKEEQISITVLTDADDKLEEGETYAEYVFDQHDFGVYNKKESISSCTDCGDTYHIVTDISAQSFTDSSGGRYVYTTQTYDVEKQTLRILDTFRTYHFVESDGTTKQMTLSRCLSYGSQPIPMPDFMQEDVLGDDWQRTFTLVTQDNTWEVAVPSDVETLVQVPNGYEVYTDSSLEQPYTEDVPEDGEKTLPDRRLYIVEAEE